jgi:hypothetical protein
LSEVRDARRNHPKLVALSLAVAVLRFARSGPPDSDAIESGTSSTKDKLEGR